MTKCYVDFCPTATLPDEMFQVLDLCAQAGFYGPEIDSVEDLFTPDPAPAPVPAPDGGVDDLIASEPITGTGWTVAGSDIQTKTSVTNQLVDAATASPTPAAVLDEPQITPGAPPPAPAPAPPRPTTSSDENAGTPTISSSATETIIDASPAPTEEVTTPIPHSTTGPGATSDSEETTEDFGSGGTISIPGGGPVTRTSVEVVTPGGGPTSTAGQPVVPQVSDDAAVAVVGQLGGYGGLVAGVLAVLAVV